MTDQTEREALVSVVTTVEAFRALDPRTAPAFITRRGLVIQTGLFTFTDDQVLELLPATVLAFAIDPDNEALALRVCHTRRGHMTPGTYACELCRGEVDRVLAALKEARS